jgi:hypothetical protein
LPKLKQTKPKTGYIKQVFGRPLKDYLWVLTLGLWVLMLTLGYIGFSMKRVSEGESPSPFDLIYLTVQLVLFESGSVPGPLPWQLEVARFGLPALAAYTALQALAILFREQTKLMRLWFIRDHVVLCGLSRKGLLLTKNLLEQGYIVVVIEIDESHDLIEQLRVRGAIILIGDATDRAVLQQAAVQRAKYLLAVCDDGVNAEIAVQAQSLTESRTRDPLTCIIHIVDPRLCDLLRERVIGGELFPGVRLETFNVFERGAQLVLEEYLPFELQVEDLTTSPHVLLIGMGRMGENLIIRMTHAWHIMADDKDEPLSITLVDRNAAEKLNFLQAQFPSLEDYCQIQTFSIDVHSADFFKADFLMDPQGRKVNIAFICFDNDALGLHVGLTLESLTKKSGIPIVVRMLEARGLASLLGERRGVRSGIQSVYAFSLLDKTCTPELLFGGVNEMLARSVHEDYVRQRSHLGEAMEDDLTLVPWDQLPEKIKDSNRRFADHICIKLEAVNCILTPLTDWDATGFRFMDREIDLMARMEHERWFEERTLESWSYGDVKDENRKTHPSLVPWEDLPKAEQEKNRNFIRDLPSILARTGYQVQRSQ